MTGRDLILYILANKLEDELVFKDGTFMGFITVEEAAVRMEVGIATVYGWILQGKLDSVQIGDAHFIPANCELKLGGNDV